MGSEAMGHVLRQPKKKFLQCGQEQGRTRMRNWRPRCHKAPGEVLPHLTVKSDVSMLPRVGPFSTMKLRSPVKMVETDHAGFHVSGWKSVMERHSLKENDFCKEECTFPMTTDSSKHCITRKLTLCCT